MVVVNPPPLWRKEFRHVRSRSTVTVGCKAIALTSEPGLGSAAAHFLRRTGGQDEEPAPCRRKTLTSTPFHVCPDCLLNNWFLLCARYCEGVWSFKGKTWPLLTSSVSVRHGATCPAALASVEKNSKCLPVFSYSILSPFSDYGENTCYKQQTVMPTLSKFRRSHIQFYSGIDWMDRWHAMASQTLNSQGWENHQALDFRVAACVCVVFLRK